MKAKIWSKEWWVKECDPKVLKPYYGNMLEQCTFKVLEVCEHYFEPMGYTCVFVLGESHFAIHTFPEEGKTYIQLSSCNKSKYDQFVNMIEV